MLWGFETADALFSSPCVSMRRLGSVGQLLVGTMIYTWANVTDGHAITAKLVYHENAWHTLSLHQLYKETPGRTGISAALHQDLQYVSIGVDRSPKPVFSPSN